MTEKHTRFVAKDLFLFDAMNGEWSESNQRVDKEVVKKCSKEWEISIREAEKDILLLMEETTQALVEGIDFSPLDENMPWNKYE